MTEGVIERIASAADKLRGRGEKSWPVLFRHLDRVAEGFDGPRSSQID